jgi:cytoskeletal protein RodZ
MNNYKKILLSIIIGALSILLWYSNQNQIRTPVSSSTKHLNAPVLSFSSSPTTDRMTSPQFSSTKIMVDVSSTPTNLSSPQGNRI